MKTTYSYIVLDKSLPVCLTVMVPGYPTMALAGEPSGNPPASAGAVEEVIWSIRQGDHKLTVRTENGDFITVYGFGEPEFGKDKL